MGVMWYYPFVCDLTSLSEWQFLQQCSWLAAVSVAGISPHQPAPCLWPQSAHHFLCSPPCLPLQLTTLSVFSAHLLVCLCCSPPHLSLPLIPLSVFAHHLVCLVCSLCQPACDLQWQSTPLSTSSSRCSTENMTQLMRGVLDQGTLIQSQWAAHSVDSLTPQTSVPSEYIYLMAGHMVMVCRKTAYSVVDAKRAHVNQMQRAWNFFKKTKWSKIVLFLWLVCLRICFLFYCSIQFLSGMNLNIEFK